MSVQSVAKSVRISPRKVSVVASLVRGRSVADAISILEHVPRRAATPVRKVIESARANADHNHGYKPDSLQITSITVTPGPRYKRFRPAAHGRALPFERKTAHIKVLVDGTKRTVKKPAANTGSLKSKTPSQAKTKEAK